MSHEQTTVELLQEIKKRCALLSESLHSEVKIADVSMTAKTPFKVKVFLESLAWRTDELARNAYLMIEKDETVSGIILIRACLEDVSSLWYLKNIIQKAVANKKIDGIDDKVMRLLVGNRLDDNSIIDNSPNEFEAVNVLTFVENLDKDIPGILDHYKLLCEYAHPNSMGTAFMYSKQDPEMRLTRLGKNIGNFIPHTTALILLNVSLDIFEHTYTELGGLMTEFILLCEEDLRTNGD